MKTKIDYRVTCWSCKGNLMENKGSYWQCRSCGATWNDTPKLGPPCLVYDDPDNYGMVHARPVAIRERQNRRPKGEED